MDHRAVGMADCPPLNRSLSPLPHNHAAGRPPSRVRPVSRSSNLEVHSRLREAQRHRERLSEALSDYRSEVVDANRASMREEQKTDLKERNAQDALLHSRRSEQLREMLRQVEERQLARSNRGQHAASLAKRLRLSVQIARAKEDAEFGRVKNALIRKEIDEMGQEMVTDLVRRDVGSALVQSLKMNVNVAAIRERSVERMIRQQDVRRGLGSPHVSPAVAELYAALQRCQTPDAGDPSVEVRRQGPLLLQPDTSPAASRRSGHMHNDTFQTTNDSCTPLRNRKSTTRTTTSSSSRPNSRLIPPQYSRKMIREEQERNAQRRAASAARVWRGPHTLVRTLIAEAQQQRKASHSAKSPAHSAVKNAPPLHLWGSQSRPPTAIPSPRSHNALQNASKVAREWFDTHSIRHCSESPLATNEKRCNTTATKIQSQSTHSPPAAQRPHWQVVVDNCEVVEVADHCDEFAVPPGAMSSDDSVSDEEQKDRDEFQSRQRPSEEEEHNATPANVDVVRPKEPSTRNASLDQKAERGTAERGTSLKSASPQTQSSPQSIRTLRAAPKEQSTGNKLAKQQLVLANQFVGSVMSAVLSKRGKDFSPSESPIRASHRHVS